ncbi:TIGR02678 family protein [Mycobacterium pinniadriaticum]|uniref:TIGR02678 family protein n=2 Tax=Mycobacterium pinniadriaticum TaxID=2994102 RepID=A0ABT3SPX3_9MYCO|nr:TIGR02678 family protein [Mycobacterium pinniadriaticum]MCX2941229.1 TIGR02678 family protein [Mycobacterium pinniadriaticum]
MAEQREAARALLLTPIVTSARSPETLAKIRLHAPALKAMFTSQLGYTLTVESSFARLAKTPLESTAPHRPLMRRGEIPFGASQYTALALICAALLAPGLGEQVLLSHLVSQVRSDAADNGIILTDNISDRRRLVAAITILMDWGVVTETDGSISQWAEGSGTEALLTVSRPMLPHLLSRGLGPTADPATILTTAPEQPRRRLRRRLVEDPVVDRRNLSAGELDVLSRERTEVTRQLEENFGLTVEVRAEGVLAYDAQGSLTDIEFPGSGSLKQAALLLLGTLIGRAESNSANLYVAWDELDSVLQQLVAAHGRSWKADYADGTSTLRRDVVALLGALALADVGDAGMTVSPAAARYRPNITQKPITGMGPS